MDFLKSIIDKFRLKELCGILFVAAIFITFVPDSIALILKISILRREYQPYISAIIIFVGSCYIYWIIERLFLYAKRKLSGVEREAKQYMKHAMTEDEKNLLIEKFYDEQSKQFRSTGYIDLSDGRKAALEYKQIIYRSSDVSAGFTVFAYNIQPYVVEVLNRNIANGNILIENDRYKFSIQ